MHTAGSRSVNIRIRNKCSHRESAESLCSVWNDLKLKCVKKKNYERWKQISCYCCYLMLRSITLKTGFGSCQTWSQITHWTLQLVHSVNLQYDFTEASSDILSWIWSKRFRTDDDQTISKACHFLEYAWTFILVYSWVLWLKAIFRGFDTKINLSWKWPKKKDSSANLEIKWQRYRACTSTKCTWRPPSLPDTTVFYLFLLAAKLSWLRF